MKKNNMKTKVTKFYKDHKAACFITAGIIYGVVGVAIGCHLVSAGIIFGSVVGTAIGKKIERDHIRKNPKKYEYESLICDDANRVLFFFNSLGKSMGSVRYLPEGDSLTEVIRSKPYINDDTEIIGVKYYFRNN